MFASRFSALLRCFAAGLLVVYVGWNLFWCSQRAVPPSLFSSLTGLPCPTTGGTRAFRCLLDGNVRESLRYNAMAIPLAALFVATWMVAVVRLYSRRSLSLPSWFVSAWIGLLLVAWAVKLASPATYW